MEKLKIALLQLLPESSPEDDLKKGINACRKARSMGADIALFPEMWSCGYDIPEDITVLKNSAVSADGDFVNTFRSLAKELKMAIAVTFLEKHDPLPRNAVSLFDGIAYLPELPPSRDTCVLEAGENEGIFIAELDLEMLREYRENEVHGNAYRRPEKYSLLLSEEIKYPFVRADRKK